MSLIVDRYMEGKTNSDNPISCRNKINDAFELTREGKSIRSVLVT